MAIQILSNSEHAVFYNGASEWAFGPLMPDADTAEAFLRTFSRHDDPRVLEDTELEKRWHKFQEKLTCPAGHTNANVVNYSRGETHIACMQKDCSLVWDLDGNEIVEEEDEEAA